MATASKAVNQKKKKSPHVIVFNGDGFDFEFVELSRAEALRLRDQGITEEDLWELWDSSWTESGICDATVLVDEKVLATFNINQFKRDKIFDLEREGKKKKWFLVKEQFERGNFQKIEIKGDFDAQKLVCEPCFYKLRGRHFGLLSFSYDGDEGQFDFTSTISSDLCLIDPEGNTYGVDVKEG